MIYPEKNEEDMAQLNYRNCVYSILSQLYQAKYI